MNAKRGGQKGNTNAMKYPSSVERRQLCKAYCSHIRQGFSKEAFTKCDMQTFKRYCKLYPSDFPAVEIETAERLGLKFWEEVGIRGSVGAIKHFNAQSWIFIMQNRYKWKLRNDLTSMSKSIKLPTTYTPSQ